MVDHSIQPPSPLGHHAAFYGVNPEEDTGRRKVSSKLPRDHIMSPPHAVNHGMSRNKIRFDHHTDEDIHQHELHNPSSTPPHDVLSIRAGRNGFTYHSKSNGHGPHDAHEKARLHNGHGNSMKSPPYNVGSQSPFSVVLKPDLGKEFHTHHQRSHSYSYMETGDCSTEGSTSRHEFDEYEEEDEGTSDFSEAERWQKDADMTSPCSSRGDASHNMLMVQGKGGPVGDRR